jgi:FixJ family two-component response regulator
MAEFPWQTDKIQQIKERHMTSPATTRILGGNPMSLAHILGHGLDLRSKVSGTPKVFVVDDDVSVRESLELLIRCEGFAPVTFASAREFLACPRDPVPSCVILDVSLPDLNGLALQKRIAIERTYMPIIFITGLRDVGMAVEAMKAGAVEFLTKPFGDEALLSAVRQALERSHATLGHQAQMRALCDRYSSLTRREQQVMALVVSGLLNKQVGGELGISEITVKAHRGQVMQKMKAGSLADLVRMATRLRLDDATASPTSFC